MEALSQCIFTILGLVLLFAGGHQGESTYWILLGLAIVMPGLVIFALLQRQGMFKRFEDWLERIAHQMGWHWLRGVTGLDEAIRVMYQNHGNLAWSFLHHTIGWIVGALEVWITLWLMGIPFGVTESLILESLGQAIRSIGFAVPGALGIQEGGYMLLGTVFGLTHETGLAISLVKRVREIIKGTPALLAWQYIEGHKLVRRYANDRSKPD
jgi:putative membrane protein